MQLIDKTAAYNALKHEAETHGLSFSAEAYDRAARIIDQMPTVEADIDRAAIMRLCNEIEDVLGELCGKYEFQLYYYSEIMKRLKAIGKELTGNEQL